MTKPRPLPGSVVEVKPGEDTRSDALAAGVSDDLAERIELLRGPFSALYGNRSGGVIQLFTRDPHGAPAASPARAASAHRSDVGLPLRRPHTWVAFNRLRTSGR